MPFSNAISVMEPVTNIREKVGLTNSPTFGILIMRQKYWVKLHCPDCDRTATKVIRRKPDFVFLLRCIQCDNDGIEMICVEGDHWSKRLRSGKIMWAEVREVNFDG
jgi:hypothetical protein